MELFEDKELEVVEKAFMANLALFPKVILYGAGNVGKILAERIIALYPAISLDSFAVSNITSNEVCVLGKCVFQIEELLEFKDSAVIVVSTLENMQSQIVEILNKNGFKNIVCMKDCLYEYWLKIEVREEVLINPHIIYIQRHIQNYINTYVDLCIQKEKNKLVLRKSVQDIMDGIACGEVYISRLVVVLGTKCSLKCQECSNLMPHFKPQSELNVEEIIQALKGLLGSVKNILRVELIGGEPFLSKNLHEVMNFLFQQKKVAQIEITTNGTVIPGIEFVPILQTDNVVVRISDYGELVNKNKILSFLNSYNIHYEVLELGKWVSPGGVEKRHKKREELRKNYLRCPSSYWCKTLYGNRIFSCARAASLYALGYMKEQEYILINDRTTSEDIRDFWNKDLSIACDYCDCANDDKKYVEPAVQIKG